MSVRVNVKYSTEEELQDILRRLEPDVKSWKVAKRQEGAFKNAYIVMKGGALPHVLVTENAEKP